MSEPTNPTATWGLSLNVDCPKCGEYVDLLSDPEFWGVNKGLEPIEHDTDRTNNLEVTCPECDHDFTVTCEY